MKPEIVDTNVLVRLLVEDNKEQQEAAVGYFRDAEKGLRQLHITPLVIAETCFVLESFYKKKRSDISGALSSLISPHWLRVENRGIVEDALRHYISGLHFVDSYLLAWKDANDGAVLTFDREVEKLAMHGGLI